MQRLSDISKADLSYIVDEFRDFTQPLELQCGSKIVNVQGSLQNDTLQMSPDVTPINAFSIALYFISVDDEEFNNSLVADHIIYIDREAYRIMDKQIDDGMTVLSLEKKTARGNR